MSRAPQKSADTERAPDARRRAEQELGSEFAPDEPLLLSVWQGDRAIGRYQRGRRYPRAIAWFGLSSFWGHLWHLAASVIATEDIDARDWMDPQSADELTAEAARALGCDDRGASLTDALAGDLWIDFVADTGDDAEVSGAVADMMFREYRLPADGAEAGVVLPRGHILLFGGDTAYPVATELEIHNRVCVPFNQRLLARQDGRMRVLLGIPGNHDWYNACDGFARMFRARKGELARSSTLPPAARAVPGGQIAHFIDWVEAFRVGEFVAKRATLPLAGYLPLQRATYFALHLAPGLDLWAVDRQLRRVDIAQRSYFAASRALEPDTGLMVITADPAFAHLDPYPFGLQTLEGVGLDLEADRLLMMSGDTHHYCRQPVGDALHVTAGGGGAFLQPARIARRGYRAPPCEFPGPRASRALAWRIPFYVAGGRAGWLVHVFAALLFAPVLLASWSPLGFACASAVVGFVVAVCAGSLAGWRLRKHRHRGGITLLAVVLGVVYATLPAAALWLLGLALGPTEPGLALSDTLAATWQRLLALALVVLPAALAFGLFLVLVTVLGLEQHHAFGALRHPGYKHFVRLRVRRDGSGVDGFTIGRENPLGAGEPTLLVDRFSWENVRASAASSRPGRPRTATRDRDDTHDPDTRDEKDESARTAPASMRKSPRK